MRTRLYSLLILSFLFINTNSDAFEWPNLWEGSLTSKLGLPEARVTDEAKLLEWDQLLKLNQYLSKISSELSIDWRILILQSLHSQEIDQRASQIISSIGNQDAATLIISVSDRMFKLEFSQGLESRLGSKTRDKLVSLMIPALAKSKYQSAIYLLLEASSYKLDPSYQVSPPLPSTRKHRSLQGLTYFLAAFFFIFLLGHKVFTSHRMKLRYVNNNGEKIGDKNPKLFHHAFFLPKKTNLNFQDKLLENNKNRVELIKKNLDINFAYFQSKAGDLYPAAHFRCSLALSILSLTVLYFFPLDWRDPIYILVVFAQSLILGYLLAFFPRVKRFFTSKREMKEETFQLLIETLANETQFLSQKSFILSYSKLENKLDFIASASLIKSREGNDLRKELITLFKKQAQNLRKVEVDQFMGELLGLLEYSPAIVLNSSTVESLPVAASNSKESHQVEQEDEKQ